MISSNLLIIGLLILITILVLCDKGDALRAFIEISAEEE